MSGLYKRKNSPYYWWTARYRGRRLRKSTKMTQKHLARKVQNRWDLNLVLGNLNLSSRVWVYHWYRGWITERSDSY